MVASLVETIDLADSVAVVTGAGSGIGRATAKILARNGADVVIPDVNLEGAEQTASEIRNLGRRSLAIKTDVSIASDVTSMVEKVTAEFSKIDILVNNAGIGTKTRKPFYEQPEEEWDKLLSIDLKGTWLCAKACFTRNDQEEKRAHREYFFDCGKGCLAPPGRL